MKCAVTLYVRHVSGRFLSCKCVCVCVRPKQANDLRGGLTGRQADEEEERERSAGRERVGMRALLAHCIFPIGKGCAASRSQQVELERERESARESELQRVHCSWMEGGERVLSKH